MQEKSKKSTKKSAKKVLLKSANKNPQMQNPFAKPLCKTPLQNPFAKSPNLRRANRPLFANLIYTYHTMAIPGPKFPKMASWGPYLPKYRGGLFANLIYLYKRP